MSSVRAILGGEPESPRPFHYVLAILGTVGVAYCIAALFISLGWNFFEGAFNPPGDGGLDAGWLICGIVFWWMGLPALLFVPKLFKSLGPRRPLILGILAGGALVGILLARWLADSIS